MSRFEAYLDKFYPGMREGVHAQTLATISAGLKNGHITLASLINVAESLADQTEDAADVDEEAEEEAEEEEAQPSLVAAKEAAAEESGAGVEGTEEDGTEVEQRGENGCLMYQGLECGGPRRGTCKAEEKVCVCLGGWTGIRCENEWFLRRYSPYTGLSEGNEDCASTAVNYLNTCN